MLSCFLSLAYFLGCVGKQNADDSGGSVVAEGKGEVSISGLDSFGTVGSAIWYRTSVDGTVDDHIRISTVSGACEAEADYLAAQSALNTAWETISDADWCTDGRAAVLAFEEASAKLSPLGSRTLTLSVANFNTGDYLLHEGSFSTDDLSSFVNGYISYDNSDALAAYESQWDESASRDDDCGVTYDRSDDVSGTFNGTLDLNQVKTLDRASGELNGSVDAGSDGTGSIAATFDAVWCEVE